MGKEKFTYIEDNIIFYSFRYCLGRKTYVVSDIVSYLIIHWSKLLPYTQNMIKKEIKIAFERDDAGDKMDENERIRDICEKCIKIHNYHTLR